MPKGNALLFCAEKQKPGQNPGKKRKNLLTSGSRCDKMVLHSVILCPYVAILICKNMISQNMAAVKRKVERFSKIDN